MKQLLDKLNITYLILTILTALCTYAFTIGADYSKVTKGISDNAKEIIEVREDVKNISKKVDEIKLTDQHVNTLNKRLEVVNRRLDDFNKEILEIYKTRK